MIYNTIVIIGANCELGNAIIERLAEDYAIYALSRDKISNPQIKCIQSGDLTHFSSFNNLNDIFDPEHNKRVIINCTGNFIGRKQIEQYKEEEINNILDSNIKPFIFSYKTFIRQMEAVKCGAFITFGSISDRYKYPRISIYNAAKEALQSLVISAANEQHKNNIRFIHINMSTLKLKKEFKYTSHDYFEVWLDPKEVANTISALLLVDSPFNKAIIDLYNYSERYYKEGYFSRVP